MLRSRTEKRLKIPLPPSYRSFLRISNGWGPLNSFVKHLLPVREIDWLRKLTPGLIDPYSIVEDDSADEAYFDYTEPSIDYRAKHLKETLQISDFHDALVLLNPQVIASDGEWEAWFFANWIPGAHRYRSFAELMRAQFHEFVGDEWSPMNCDVPLPTEYLGSPGSAKRRVKQRKPPGPQASAEKLLAALQDSKLARKLYPKAKGGMYGPSPEIAALQRVISELGRRRESSATEIMLAMLDSESNRAFLEHELMQALARMGDPRVVDVLDRFVINDNGNSASAAISALMIADPARAREAALRLLRERGFMFPTAMTYLGMMKERRAIPVLLDIARDPSPQAQHNKHYVGQGLSQLGKEGFEALVALARTPDVSLRQIAVNGLMYCRGHPVHETLEALALDSDDRIRQSAKIALQVAGPRRGGG
jgi:hypothetical protein